MQLVVMGNQMKQGESYMDAFAPVPHSTAGRVMMSLAAALNLKMHCVDHDLSQAFIQALWAYLLEAVPQVFICPPQGWDEDPWVVYKVLFPLYVIWRAADACTSHLTIPSFR
eukprot:2625271-Rhodomonas_salina.3